jgi:hypothetical protein
MANAHLIWAVAKKQAAIKKTAVKKANKEPTAVISFFLVHLKRCTRKFS